jgi:hypothetical protein
MIDSPLRKNKISLADYDFKQDIHNRSLMADFTVADVAVLEEILFSSLQIPIKKLQESLELDEFSLKKSLDTLAQTKLFAIEGNTLIVDKEMRKYYESQILKFDEDFEPGVEFIQGLLKKVPIHLLPVWYTISRTSNNIFQSLVEKYFYTPQLFQRYLKELTLEEKVLKAIVDDVYRSEELELTAAEIIEKYDLSREQFEEYMLLLEFNLVCFLKYRKKEEHWEEIVSTFHEWKEYISFLESTSPKPIEEEIAINERELKSIADLSQLLNLLKEDPISVVTFDENELVLDQQSLNRLGASLQCDHDHIYALTQRLLSLRFADIVDGKLYAVENGDEWLELSLENRALYIYRYHLNSFRIKNGSLWLVTPRNIREAEKSISRIANSGWIYLDDFLKSLAIPLNEKSTITLKKAGRGWKYSLPEYSAEELSFIESVVMDWLYEVGFICKGVHKGRKCLKVSDLGKSFFAH